MPSRIFQTVGVSEIGLKFLGMLWSWCGLGMTVT